MSYPCRTARGGRDECYHGRSIHEPCPYSLLDDAAISDDVVGAGLVPARPAPVTATQHLAFVSLLCKNDRQTPGGDC
jgi:hypothetical protein